MDPVHQFLDALQGVQTVRFAELASSMIIFYEHLITLDQEVELIWKAGWSFGKCLFLLNRYYTLFVAIFNNFVLFGPRIGAACLMPFSLFLTIDSWVPTYSCEGWFRWQGATGITAFILGELILQLRLYALYDLDKRVLVLMGSVFISAVAASSVIMAFALAKIQAVSLSLFGNPVCAPLNLPEATFFYAFWIPMLASESVLCGLAIYRALSGWRRRSTLAATGRALVRVLIRDSILYFLIMFIVYLVNLLIFLRNNATLTESTISYAVSLSCVIGNRLCLNVRGMIWHDDDIIITSEGPSHNRNAKSSFRDRSQPYSVVVVTQDRQQLSEFEMDELRSMRPGDYR